MSFFNTILSLSWQDETILLLLSPSYIALHVLLLSLTFCSFSSSLFLNYYKRILIFFFIFFPFSFPKDCKSSMCGNFVSMPNSYLPLSPFTQKVWGVVACVGQHINYNIYSKKRRKLAWPFEEYEHFECLFG